MGRVCRLYRISVNRRVSSEGAEGEEEVCELTTLPTISVPGGKKELSVTGMRWVVVAKKVDPGFTAPAFSSCVRRTGRVVPEESGESVTIGEPFCAKVTRVAEARVRELRIRAISRTADCRLMAAAEPPLPGTSGWL